jgi:acyl-CoA thioesterase
MTTLRSISNPVRDGDRFRIDIPAGWRQGRGAFGGLTVGTLIRAIEQTVADPARAVRSVTAELPGPTEPGPSEIAVDVLRRGNSVSTVRAALVQQGEVRSHAVAIVAAARALDAPLTWRELRPPEAPPWQDVAASGIGIPTPGGPPWPEFAQHFEYRPVEGIPLAGGPARCVGWIRPRHPDAAYDAGAIAALVDAWFPAAMVRMPQMRPCATIAFTLDLIDRVDDLDPAVPLLYRGTVPVCGDGYFLETRELWGEDGRLVAINHQTFAVIR